MTENNQKIVWILGAGFSRGLGGPLFADIFRRGTLETLYFTFPSMRKELVSDVAKYVVWLYNYGIDFKYGPGLTEAERRLPDEQDTRFGNPSATTGNPGDGEHLWEDAEDFLKKLDECANDDEIPLQGKISKLLQLIFDPNKMNIIPPSPKEMAECSKRLTAAQCSAFLEGNSTDTEQWKPYLTWAESLGAGDTVITFNYDLVLERIIKSQKGSSKLDVITPGDESERYLSRTKTGVPVFKLHGATNWARDVSDPKWVKLRLHENDYFALTCQSCELALGTPGPQKVGFSEELTLLWQAAKKELHVADAIVFLGYRFPPSDAYAREQLLIEGLAENKQPFIAVHTVLGPNTNNEDTVRLKSLIWHSLRRANRIDEMDARRGAVTNVKTYRLVSQPLYAQDFLQVASRATILQPD